MFFRDPTRMNSKGQDFYDTYTCGVGQDLSRLQPELDLFWTSLVTSRQILKADSASFSCLSFEQSMHSDLHNNSTILLMIKVCIFSLECSDFPCMLSGTLNCGVLAGYRL